jgi:hypothetical protein
MIKVLDNGVEAEFDDETGRCLRVRVPSFAMDGKPAAPQAMTYDGYCRDHQARLRDYAKIGAKPGHQPGVVPLSDAERRARADAVEERSRALADAWRGGQEPPRWATAEEARQVHAEWLQNAWRAR